MLLLSAFLFILILFLITFFYLKGGDFKEMFKENPDDLKFDEQENRTQGWLFIAFGIGFLLFILFLIFKWGGSILPESGSVHGADVDSLMLITGVIISIVFVITHVLLFFFVFKYAFNKNRKPAFFTHNLKLELLWTALPAMVLVLLISIGLYNWNSIMKPLDDKDDKVLIEIYAKQFDWTARYAGNDGKLGRANIVLINNANFLGIDTTDVVSFDDKIVKNEFHIPVNKPVQFVFRAQDVMHSAYMPHFRAQMNCVPGLKTQFNFTPKYTTQEMRRITKNPDFDYMLLCNKICGMAHFAMKMKIVVESEEDYNKWLAINPTFR
ncbi:MAG: cytochrome c oxidase subunit II [Flavobacteriaceae bacterium]|nr:cytochrome c oxidase subunit II [Flavobacteriaceae bacterium]